MAARSGWPKPLVIVYALKEITEKIHTSTESVKKHCTTYDLGDFMEPPPVNGTTWSDYSVYVEKNWSLPILSCQSNAMNFYLNPGIMSFLRRLVGILPQSDVLVTFAKIFSSNDTRFPNSRKLKT